MRSLAIICMVLLCCVSSVVAAVPPVSVPASTGSSCDGAADQFALFR